MRRREFIKGMTAGAGFLTLANVLPRFGMAAESELEQQFFVMIYVPSGWDVSLATAPWIFDQRPSEAEYFIEYRQDELIRTPYGFLGPAMMPLSKYAADLRVVNGVFMNASEVGHASLSMYAMTGNGQGELSNLAAEIDYNVIRSPFGTVASGQIIKSKAVNIVNADGLLLIKEIPSDDFIATETEIETEITKAKKNMVRFQDRVKEFLKIRDDLKVKYGRLAVEDSIISSFAAGLSKTAFIELFSGGLDSHSNHPGQHKRSLTEAFAKIATVLEKFEQFSIDGKSSLLSRTTFMVVSDFARTPALNGSKGKDHNPQANSVLLLGPNINPGITGDIRLIKRANSKFNMPYLASVPIDKKTEQPTIHRENAMIIRPENVMASVLTSMNINPVTFGSSLASAQILNSIIK